MKGLGPLGGQGQARTAPPAAKSQWLYVKKTWLITDLFQHKINRCHYRKFRKKENLKKFFLKIFCYFYFKIHLIIQFIFPLKVSQEECPVC